MYDVVHQLTKDALNITSDHTQLGVHLARHDVTLM